jgi:hypothetical protein
MVCASARTSAGRNTVSAARAEQPGASHFRRRNQPVQTVTFDAGKNKAANLKEGDARIVVETVADDFRGSGFRVHKRQGDPGAAA